ncbi:MAG: DUF134 domain-containing protein [Spirochaetia bacterium]|nr:DUF134 domain-containing protein [Spirochaetia bacterium]
MSRSKMKRVVLRPPLYADFKPTGVQKNEKELLLLELDEFEAVRLADYLGMEHTEAATEMEISRSTFSRLIDKARKKISCFLIEGKHLQIEGGNIHFRGNLIRCRNCGHMFNVAFETDIERCPGCGSRNLLDLAGGFGHGNCCREHGRYGRR